MKETEDRELCAETLRKQLALLSVRAEKAQDMELPGLTKEMCNLVLVLTSLGGGTQSGNRC